MKIVKWLNRLFKTKEELIEDLQKEAELNEEKAKQLELAKIAKELRDSFPSDIQEPLR